MVRSGKLLFFLVTAFTIGNNAKAQQISSSIIGKWISIKPYYNKTMEVVFSGNDSSYTEIVRNAENKKVISRYKVHFKIVNDSTIMLSGKSGNTYNKLAFTNTDTVKFYPYKKELKESIPLSYLFTFKKIK